VRLHEVIGFLPSVKKKMIEFNFTVHVTARQDFDHFFLGTLVSVDMDLFSVFLYSSQRFYVPGCDGLLSLPVRMRSRSFVVRIHCLRSIL
jgi:hypothetical protein